LSLSHYRRVKIFARKIKVTLAKKPLRYRPCSAGRRNFPRKIATRRFLQRTNDDCITARAAREVRRCILVEIHPDSTPNAQVA
jgi:hypothetical protein